MAGVVTRSLMAKLVAAFLAVTLLPIAIVGYLSFSNGGEALREATLAALSSAREQVRENIVQGLEEALSDMKYQAKNPAVQSAFRTMKAYLDYAVYLEYGQEHPEAPVDVKSEEYQKTIADIDPMFSRFLQNYQSDRDYQDLLLIVGEEIGLIMYTGKKLTDLGTSLSKGPLKESSLARLWRTVLKTGKIAMVDYATYGPSDTVSAFLGVPVLRDDGKKMYGVLVLRLGVERIGESLDAVQQLGTTADAFVVGKDLSLLSESKRSGQSVLLQKVESGAARSGLEGKSGIGEAIGLQGEKVLNAWAPVRVRAIEGLGADFDWAIIAKMDSSEALAAVHNLATRVILMALIIGALVAVLAYLLARRMANPIVLIAEKARLISDGDLTADVPELGRSDELGRLSDSFRHMSENLRMQITRILEGVNVLISSATEISTTVSQVSTSTNKTSSAVAETTATVEQVKQSAKLSGDKAKQVAKTSKEAVTISEAGKKATDDTIKRMNLIREQMDSIGKTVIRLSDQSQAIEEIIAAVQDLADQSNLLAVNASIEAARAGDQGKGFAVVAHEIKSLADQSKEATEQVRSILDDTRKWVSAVVMATEQGSKAVEAGVEQSVIAGESIEALAETVMESSQAASVIDSSTEQQFVGVEQVATAMANIAEAMSQNVDGTRQLESAAKRLDELGSQLHELVERYRV